MNVKLTKKILRSARKKMERYAARDNSVSDIDTLNCLCGISTYVLFVCFDEMGYKPMFCMNDNHCFLRMQGYWIDLTLRQFNDKCPKIYFEKKPYKKDDGYGNIHLAQKKTRSIKRVRRWFRIWPIEQNPFRQGSLPKLVVPKITA